MPDWTYHTLFRPLLRRVSYPIAQACAFAALGRLGRFALGRSLIRLLGHGQPPPDAATSLHGHRIASPVGLSCGIDLQTRATSALSLFGFGLIEIGPVRQTENSRDSKTPSTQWDRCKASLPRSPPGFLLDQLASHLEQFVQPGVQLLLRIDSMSPDELDRVLQIAERFDHVLGLVQRLSPGQEEHPDEQSWRIRQQLAHRRGLRLMVMIEPASVDWICARSDSFCAAVDGIVIDLDRPPADSDSIDLAEAPRLLQRLRHARPQQTLLTSGGITEPADAVALLNAGASAVLAGGGFVAAGPGLPKRINEALVTLRSPPPSDQSAPSLPLGQLSWFWSFLMGLSLTVGGLLALGVGWTRVVLPYDEHFLNLQREEICSLNDRLLPFMSHDRVTLAGTILALGPLYLALAWFGDRRGQHWARVAVVASALAGFLSFFSFLGFGYFDPFHAFVSAVLFQLLALGLHSSLSPPQREPADLRNSAAWKRALWGQLLMVLQGLAILVAGLTICTYGMTTVFVDEDLEFLQVRRETLRNWNPNLVPLVAHDRATFGGMLMATGITVLLSSLWGWRRGRRWLWWTLLLSGSTAYLTTILIHWWVAYTSLVHLLPAYGGLVVLWIAMACSRPWMCDAISSERLPET